MSTQLTHRCLLKFLFIIVKTCKSTTLSLIVIGYIKWYIYTMECYLALKKNELFIHEKTWRKEYILLSERNNMKRLHAL